MDTKNELASFIKERGEQSCRKSFGAYALSSFSLEELNFTNLAQDVNSKKLSRFINTDLSQSDKDGPAF